FTCVQFHTGQLACNGADYYRQLAASGDFYPDLGQVALGPDHGCALFEGVPHCWGINSNGQAGNGHFGHEYEPVVLAGAGAIHAPRVGWQEGCWAATDGVASCWGGTFPSDSASPTP